MHQHVKSEALLLVTDVASGLSQLIITVTVQVSLSLSTY